MLRAGLVPVLKPGEQLIRRSLTTQRCGLQRLFSSYLDEYMPGCQSMHMNMDMSVLTSPQGACGSFEVIVVCRSLTRRAVISILASITRHRLLPLAAQALSPESRRLAEGVAGPAPLIPHFSGGRSCDTTTSSTHLSGVHCARNAECSRHRLRTARQTLS